MLFQHVEAAQQPVTVPLRLDLFRQAEVVHEIAQHAQVVHRMDVAGDDLRQLARARAAASLG
ncbi:hypothetical protein, partial [Massilia phosphatilytica]